MVTKLKRALIKPLPAWTLILVLLALLIQPVMAAAPTYYGYFQSPGGIASDGLAIPTNGFYTDLLVTSGSPHATVIGPDFASSADIGLCPSYSGSCTPVALVHDDSGNAEIETNELLLNTGAQFTASGGTHCGNSLSSLGLFQGATFLAGSDGSGDFCFAGEVSSLSGYYVNGVGSPPLGDIFPTIVQGSTSTSGSCSTGTICSLAANPACPSVLVQCSFSILVEDNVGGNGNGWMPEMFYNGTVYKLAGFRNDTGSTISNGTPVAYSAQGG